MYYAIEISRVGAETTEPQHLDEDHPVNGIYQNVKYNFSF
jgi:hypothetical protein